MKNVNYYNLGYIGHNAEPFQQLFSEYSKTPNKYGYFLEFENFTHGINEGVSVSTNAFQNESHFNEILMSKLKWFYLESKMKSSKLYKQII
jgi:hypothetical protein